MKALKEFNETIKKLFEIAEKIDIEASKEMHEYAPVVIHQRLCHELVAVGKKNPEKLISDVPEMMKIMDAIEVLESLYPQLKTPK